MKIRRADLERLLEQAREVHSDNVDDYARAVKEQSRFEKRSNEYNSAGLAVEWSKEKMDKSASAAGNLRHAIACLDDLGVLI